MANFGLRDYQLEAIGKMKRGCILCGGVGSGKSRTGLAYYFKECGGKLYSETEMAEPLDLYIITTARKRDSLEWNGELEVFNLYPKESCPYRINITVDSWNNVVKYKTVENAFFIFDEDRVTGYGAWVKSFLKIAKSNHWIILSATPGDTWSDYIPVLIANGFYKNKTEFCNEHVIYSRFTKFPKIERYLGTAKLSRLVRSLLIPMEFERETVQHHEYVKCNYDALGYKEILRNRWDPWDKKPLTSASDLCYALRKSTNLDISRQTAVVQIIEDHPKVIIYYNFNYELDILRNLLERAKVPYAEWNGQKHEPVPTGPTWAYLVQYAAGAEAWNCTTTDAMIFYSQNYSYRTLVQAEGRIDRMNTPYKDLYYYHLRSFASIDVAIYNALRHKKQFNESKFAGSAQ